MAMLLPTEEDDVVSSINTTPLVDVMLVLLIIFLIAVPVVVRAIQVELPRETSHPSAPLPQNIVVAVDRNGQIYWGEEALENRDALLNKLKQAASQPSPPSLQLRGDAHVRYEYIGQVLYEIQRSGLQRVAFMTDPGD